MKAKYLISSSMMAIALLAGCTNKPSPCYPGGKCNHYQIYDRCGSSLKYECEDICKQCQSYEPQCYSCYACIESSPQQCLKEQAKSGACPK